MLRPPRTYGALVQFLVIGPPRSAEGHLLLPASQPGCCERICNRGPCLGPIPAIPGKPERSAPPPHTATVQPPAHLSLSLSAPHRSPPLTGATTTTAGIFVLSPNRENGGKTKCTADPPPGAPSSGWPAGRGRPPPAVPPVAALASPAPPSSSSSAAAVPRSLEPPPSRRPRPPPAGRASRSLERRGGEAYRGRRCLLPRWRTQRQRQRQPPPARTGCRPIPTSSWTTRTGRRRCSSIPTAVWGPARWSGVDQGGGDGSRSPPGSGTGRGREGARTFDFEGEERGGDGIGPPSPIPLLLEGRKSHHGHGPPPGPSQDRGPPSGSVRTSLDDLFDLVYIYLYLYIYIYKKEKYPASRLLHRSGEMGGGYTEEIGVPPPVSTQSTEQHRNRRVVQLSNTCSLSDNIHTSILHSACTKVLASRFEDSEE